MPPGSAERYEPAPSLPYGTRAFIECKMFIPDCIIENFDNTFHKRLFFSSANLECDSQDRLNFNVFWRTPLSEPKGLSPYSA
jgi:hypothetical protein